MNKLTQVVAIALTLAISSFAASSAFAIPSCGQCVPGTAPKSHTGYGITNSSLCTTCHTVPTTPTTPVATTTPPTATPPSMPVAPLPPAIVIHPTTHGCGNCVSGTAPSSVSAHKNVNQKMIVCSICHSNSSNNNSLGNTVISPTNGIPRSHSDDNSSTTSPNVTPYIENHQNSPGNSDYGHSHQRNPKQTHEHDN